MTVLADYDLSELANRIEIDGETRYIAGGMVVDRAGYERWKGEMERRKYEAKIAKIIRIELRGRT